MKLLDPHDIKKHRSESAEEARKRNNALASEESRLARAVNKARATAEAAIKQIDDDFQAYSAEIKEKRRQLASEVESLETRRLEAMEPIKKLRKDAEKILADARQFAADVAAEKADLEADKEKNSELAEALQDRSDELNLREQKLEQKEKHLASEQERQQESSKKLGDKWFKLGQAVSDHNKQVAKLETERKRLAIIEATQETRHQKQQEREAKQIEHDRAIEDKYNTLALAIEEAKKNYPNLKYDGRKKRQ